MQSPRKKEPEPEVAERSTPTRQPGAFEESGVRRIPEETLDDLSELAVLVPAPASPPPVPILRPVRGERVDPDALLREYLPRAPYDDRSSTYPFVPGTDLFQPSPPTTARFVIEVPARATAQTVLVVLVAAALVAAALAL